MLNQSFLHLCRLILSRMFHCFMKNLANDTIFVSTITLKQMLRLANIMAQGNARSQSLAVERAEPLKEGRILETLGSALERNAGS